MPSRYISPSSNHLALLLAMRGSVLLMEALLVLIFYLMGMRAQLTGVAVLMLLQLTTNIFTAWRLGRARPVGHAEFFGHIFVDIVALTWIFYLTGGYANPLIWAYLLPLIVQLSLPADGVIVIPLPVKLLNWLFEITLFLFGIAAEVPAE